MTSTRAEREAANVGYPGDAYLRATVTSAEACITPTAWLNKFVDITAIGVDVYIRFGTTDAVTVDRTTVSSRTGTTAFSAATAGPHLVIPAGTTKVVRWDASHLYFAHISTATTGYVYLAMSTGDDA